MCDLHCERQAVGNQRDRDDALAELFQAMSTGLSHVMRFDKVAVAKDDKDVIRKVAEKTQECAQFISEYTKTTSFGTLFVCRMPVYILNFVFLQSTVQLRACSSTPQQRFLGSRRTLTPSGKSCSSEPLYLLRKVYPISKQTCITSRKA